MSEYSLIDTALAVLVTLWVRGASVIGEVYACVNGGMPVTLDCEVQPIWTVEVFNPILLDLILIGVEEVDSKLALRKRYVVVILHSIPVCTIHIDKLTDYELPISRIVQRPIPVEV